MSTRARPAELWPRKLNLKAKWKQNCKQSIIFYFQALSSRHFQHGLHRVDLHCPTEVASTPSSFSKVKRRKLKLKAKFESGLSDSSFKR